jgi:hypothetical protein
VALDRRSFLLGAAGLLVAGPALAAVPGLPAGNKIAFIIVRKDENIGSHVLDFSGTPENPIVQVTVDIVVKLGPIPLYRYKHRAREEWQDGKFASVVSETDDDGKAYKLTVKRTGDGFEVDGNEGKFKGPANMLPATHWNKAELENPMLNTQTGKLMKPQIEKLGPNAVKRASGGTVNATRYRMSGPDMDGTPLDLWFDDKDTWCALAFTKSGTEIRYVLA